MTVPLCKDCLYYEPYGFIKDTCKHPSALQVDLVTGEEWYQKCSYQRFPFGKCKVEAIHFQERKKIPYISF